MKTITEFTGFALARGLTVQSEAASQNKTDEETSQALAESFKVEGDKLDMLKQALSLAARKPERLKRIIVATKLENETPPNTWVALGERYYQTEYFPAPPQAERPRKDRAFGKDRGDGKKKGPRKGRGNERQDRAFSPRAKREDSTDRGAKNGDRLVVTPRANPLPVTAGDGSAQPRAQRPRRERKIREPRSQPVVKIKIEGTLIRTIEMDGKPYEIPQMKPNAPSESPATVNAPENSAESSNVSTS